MDTKETFVPQVAFHPAVTLREKLKEMDMPTIDFIFNTPLEPEITAALYNERIAVTPNIAKVLEDLTRIPAHFWLKKQRLYDEYLARQKEHECTPDKE